MQEDNHDDEDHDDAVGSYNNAGLSINGAASTSEEEGLDDSHGSADVSFIKEQMTAAQTASACGGQDDQLASFGLCGAHNLMRAGLPNFMCF